MLYISYVMAELTHTNIHILYGILPQNTKWDLTELLVKILVSVNKCCLVYLQPLSELQNHIHLKVQKMSHMNLNGSLKHLQGPHIQSKR